MASNAHKSTEQHSKKTHGSRIGAVSVDVDARGLKSEREQRWLAEHADAIRAENEYIEKDGLPLAKYRLF